VRFTHSALRLQSASGGYKINERNQIYPPSVLSAVSLADRPDRPDSPEKPEKPNKRNEPDCRFQTFCDKKVMHAGNQRAPLVTLEKVSE